MDKIIIKIPKGLPSKLASSSQEQKAVSLLLMLKSFYDSGNLINTTLKIKEAAKNCGVCYNTFNTHLDMLKALKLARVQGGFLYLASWQELYEHYGLKGKQRFYIITKDSKIRLEHYIQALAIEEDNKRLEAAFYFYLSRHPEIKEELKHVFGSANRSAIQYWQLQAYLNYYAELDDNESFILNMFNADLECNYDTWSDFFGYNSFGGLAYKKRKLASLNLIRVTKRQYLLHCHTTVLRRTTYLGKVKYSPYYKKPVLHRPDAITSLVKH